MATIGYFTDLHYGPHAPATYSPEPTRYYTDGLQKLGAIVAQMNSFNVDAVVCGGDLIDADSATDYEDRLADTEAALSELTMPWYWCLGNHDCDWKPTSYLLANSAGFQSGGTLYHKFNLGSLHFYILDANYYSDDDADHYEEYKLVHGSDGSYYYNVYVNPAQRTWLQSELGALGESDRAFVFVHESMTTLAGPPSVRLIDNSAALHTIFTNTGDKVDATFCGHWHLNGNADDNGVPNYQMFASTHYEYPAITYAIITIT